MSSSTDNKSVPPPGPEEPQANKIKEAGGLIPYLRSMVQTYGSTFSFSNESTHYYCTLDPNIIKKTLKMGSRPIPLFDFLIPLLGKDNAQVWDGARAKKGRGLFRKAYSHDSVKHHFKNMEAIIVEMVKEWEKKVKAGEKEIAAQQDLLHVAIKISLILVGITDFNWNIDEFINSYDLALDYTFDSQFGLLGKEKEEEMKEAVSRVRQIIYEKAQAAKAPEDVNTITKLLLQDDPNTGEPFTKAAYIGHVVGHTLAAYHTSAIATLWTLLFLDENPKWQDKLREEILAVEEPTYDVLKNLPTMSMILKESLRLKTPGPFAARLFEEDLECEGYCFKKGSALLYPLSLIHEDKEKWKEPKKFDPTRFEKRPPPNTYLPFGVGARMCYGETAAWAEMRLLLFHILKRFVVKHEGKQVESVERFVQMPKEPVSLHLKLVE